MEFQHDGWFVQGILLDVLKCLADNKKHMRESTLSTLESWHAAVHLDKMLTICFDCLHPACVLIF